MEAITINNFQLWRLCKNISIYQPTNPEQLKSVVFCLDLLRTLGVGPIVDKYAIEQQQATQEVKTFKETIKALEKKHKKSEKTIEEMAKLESSIKEISDKAECLDDTAINGDIYNELLKEENKGHISIIISDIMNHGTNPDHRMSHVDMRAINHLIGLFSS